MDQTEYSHVRSTLWEDGEPDGEETEEGGRDPEPDYYDTDEIHNPPKGDLLRGLESGQITEDRGNLGEPLVTQV